MVARLRADHPDVTAKKVRDAVAAIKAGGASPSTANAPRPPTPPPPVPETDEKNISYISPLELDAVLREPVTLEQLSEMKRDASVGSFVADSDDVGDIAELPALRALPALADMEKAKKRPAGDG